jgi:hypothetical protein
MGGHGHHDHNQAHGNPNNIKESDDEIVSKIREIELIKHNPNLFWLWVYNPVNIYNILGGYKWAASASIGGLAGWWYFAQKLRHNPLDFYTRILLRSSRIGLGAVIGGFIGYLKFGER